MRRWGWLNHPQRAFSLTLWCHFLPARMPLVTPGIPCISETLLLVKYSSQVAFRYSESQKDLHNLVVTVSLSVSMSFAQTSYPLESSVRFPRRQTLERMPRKVSHSRTSHYHQQNTGHKSLTGRPGGQGRSWWLQHKQPGWRGWHRPGRPVPACLHTWPPQTPPKPWSSEQWSRTPACCWGELPLPPAPPGPRS